MINSRQNKWLLLLGLSVVAMFASLGFGSSEIGFAEITQCLVSECQNDSTQLILSEFRLPRVLVGFVAGMGLAVAGCLLQNITRNPLADPYLFGIIAGAGLGATLLATFGSPLLQLGLPVAAFLGALLAVFLVVMAVAGRGWQRVEVVLLAGVAVSYMLTAMTNFLLYLGDEFSTNRVIFWLMGSLARVDFTAFYVITPLAIGIMLWALANRRQFDALLLNDESAQALGVNVNRLRIMVLIACAALTGAVVAYCGGIGFVGLMIPHMIRPFFGVLTASSLVASGLAGGCFLVIVDIFARTLLSDQELPIGVITSAIGSIFFLALLRRNKN